MRCTAKLAEWLRLNPGTLEVIEKEIRTNVKMLGEEKGSARARLIGQPINKWLGEESAIADAACASCDYGYCCYQLIPMSQNEAVRIEEEYPGVGDRELAERQRKWISADEMEPAEWQKLPIELRKCMFFDDVTGKCKVYAARPIVCQTHYVTKGEEEPSVMCNTEGSRMTSVIVLPLVECAVSAMQITSRQKPMPWRFE